MRYRAVIFDLWQTSIPWPTESAKALYVQMADSVGAPRAEFEEVWLSGRSARDTGPIADSVRWVFGQLGLDADPQTIISLRRDWTRDSIIPRPDAVSTLEELRRRGHKLGLITVCSTDVAELWDASPFGGLFDATVFSCEVGISKPDPRIYELCCEQLGRRAGRVPLRRRRRELRAAGRGEGRHDGAPAARAGRGAHRARQGVGGALGRAALRTS